ncbi:hypothetical protein EV361DRAFT_488728 [Lentinula raphanica]|nr:hypothetical protein EV361DRAFT_488728 [Lentinula raphanica]
MYSSFPTVDLKPVALPTVVPQALHPSIASDGAVHTLPYDITFWGIRDLRYNLFSFLPITALFSLSGTCQQLRVWVQEFYEGRVTSVLGDVVPKDDVPAFLRVVNRYEGRIGGSTAYRIADPLSVFKPNDLNILVPFGCRIGIRNNLVRNWKCTVAVNGKEIGRKNLKDWSTGTSLLLTDKGYRITITESFEDSIIPLVLAGYSTAECVLMGLRSFTLLYPSLVSEGTVVKMSSFGVDMPPQCKTNLDARFNFQYSTEYLGVRCAEACPSLWRRSAAHRWCATFEWNGYADGDDIVEEKRIDWGNLEWKVGYDCKNVHCGWQNRRPVELCSWKSWDV